MRTILIIVGLAALGGCALPHFYLGDDSDARLLCRASISINHIHGIKVRCNSDLRPNHYLQSGGEERVEM